MSCDVLFGSAESDPMNKILIHPPQGIPQNVVLGYLNNCRRNLPALKEAIARRDYEHMRVFGHKMKGVGGAYGFPALSEAGAVIEQAAVSIAFQATAIEEYLGRIELAGD
jgi:HPt (histidine-containing phosphotransfer) domain-containing protein